MVVNLAWRLFKHEAKRGELSIILLAIILSVASVLSLSLFSERLQAALTDRSAEFIAADRQLRSRNVVDEAWIKEAQTQALYGVWRRRIVIGRFKGSGSKLSLERTN
jgi:putative ABC transport system permease protein